MEADGNKEMVADMEVTNKPMIDFRLYFNPSPDEIERVLKGVSQAAGRHVQLSDCIKLEREFDNFACRQDTYRYDPTR